MMNKECTQDFVSDGFLNRMESYEYLPLARGWFGLKVVKRVRDNKRGGYIFHLEKKN